MLSEADIETLSCPKSTSACVIIKDDAFADILDSIYKEVDELKQFLRPAKMSRGDHEWENEEIRGDSLCWITPKLCIDKSLNNLIAFSTRILEECTCFKEILGLGNDYNFQFALYPGKGEGYHRHRDAFPSTFEITACNTRQLTCILYLNKYWETSDGGQLRIFTNPGVTIDGAGEAFDFWGLHGCDIFPLSGRLVIFRSELVEHAVLPCFYERMALTLWINGEGPPQNIRESHIAVAAKIPLVYNKEYFDKYKYVPKEGEVDDEEDEVDDEDDEVCTK